MAALDTAGLTTIERSCTIDAPIAEVFAFHLDTRNAARIASPGQRVLSVEGTFPLREGSEVRLRVRQLPSPWAQTWLVRVVELEEPTLLVDELVRGPFPSFRHEHRFTELPGGRTRLTDHITYRLPAGALGRVANALIVRRILLASFRSRQARTAALLGGGTG
jgi:ligand-binding SRPBCC domain-containing protein